MNKLKTFLIVAFSATIISVPKVASSLSPTDYVNPFIGASCIKKTAGVYHGLGKTFPGATTPFGMVQVSPNTITGGDHAPGYSREHTSIEGFAFTQMSGVGWIGDLGNFLVTPTNGPLKKIAGLPNGKIKGYRSDFDKNSEVAKAGYYSVNLSTYNIKVESSATPHCGILKFTFPEDSCSRIQIDLARKVGGTSVEQYVEVVDKNTIKGWMKCTPKGGGWGNGKGKVSYTFYFYAKFSVDLDNYGFWSAPIPSNWARGNKQVVDPKYLAIVDKAKIIKGEKSAQGPHLGFFTEFATEKDEEVELKVGVSFVDLEGAENNFNKEIAKSNFKKVRDNADKLWNKELNRIAIKGGTDEQKTIFYTALYHTMIDPRIFSDVDGRYTGGDNKIHASDGKFEKRTIFSGWDVFRSQFPLQTIINPQLVSDMINSLVTLAEETGYEYFERWELFNSYSGCMLGNPALSVLTDAYNKGIRTYDIDKAYKYAVNTAEEFGNDEKLGYADQKLSISYTLEYCYTDWCLGKLAEMVGRKDDAKKYYAKSKAYVNIFDKEKRWFRPKIAGEWAEWKGDARLKHWYGCMESNPYQQGWFVPHDTEGMVKLMGGTKAAAADLASFFENTPKTYMWNNYYNHANEPVHFVPFLFNKLREPWNTQKWSRDICNLAYKNDVKGLVGNDDVGQISAWYILTSSGIHPSCPGDNRMEITSPLFDKIEYTLDKRYAEGKKFTIIAHNNSPENIYIQSAKLNGKSYNNCYLDFSEIKAGATLELTMGATPNKNWGLE